jgi:hypothetical protein
MAIAFPLPFLSDFLLKLESVASLVRVFFFFLFLVSSATLRFVAAISELRIEHKDGRLKALCHRSDFS